MTVHLTQAAAAAHRPARYHFEAPRRRFVPRERSACAGMPLDRASGRDPADVPADRRCRGRGCAERWGAVDQPADLISSAEEASTP